MDTVFESDVVILARTKMHNYHVCVGGYALHEKRYVRLLTSDAKFLDSSANYQIGGVYHIQYTNRLEIIEPHTEDICMRESSFLGVMKLEYFKELLQSVCIPNMHIANLFNKNLHWGNQEDKYESGYLLEGNIGALGESVVIVTLMHDLFKLNYYCYNGIYFGYRDSDTNKKFRVKYVGDNDIGNLRKIVKGRYLRFSLTRWWSNDGKYDPSRSYLQLSAIY